MLGLFYDSAFCFQHGGRKREWFCDITVHTTCIFKHPTSYIYSLVFESIRIVTGPSFTKATFILAPNTPV